MLKILGRCKREVILKVITSLFLQALLLIIPIFWSNTINHVTGGDYKTSYFLVIITLILSLFYYVWCYLNQKSWYRFYDSIYLELTRVATRKRELKDVSLGEYTNIINNDIDIVGTFFGNIVTIIMQVIEFLNIYVYFFCGTPHILAIHGSMVLLLLRMLWWYYPHG